MTRKDKVKDSYDKIARQYHRKTDENSVSKSQENIIEEYKSTLQKNNVILDVGCGGQPIEASGIDTIGLDFSREQINTNNIPNIDMIQGDMINLPFKSNYFDGLTAFYSLIHVPLKFHQKTINEFSRVIKQGSSILITEGVREWVGSNEGWLDTDTEMSWEVAGKDKTKEHLKNAGFEIMKIKPVKDTLGKNENTKIFFFAKLK